MENLPGNFHGQVFIGWAVGAILEISERRLKDMSSLLSFRSKVELAVLYKNRIYALRS